MHHKQLHENAGQRTFVVVLDAGEEIMQALQDFVEREKITAAQFAAIGALSDAVLLYFDWERKDYIRIPVREQGRGSVFDR
jgi:uncharacterized protein